MPLARYALYGQGLDIYVAPTWDTGDTWLATLRHIAREAGCWVVGTATAMQGSDLPDDFPDSEALYEPEEWINDGGAVVIKPMGNIAAGPLHREKGILYAEVDKELAKRARRSLDVCGHYSRPDGYRSSAGASASTGFHCSSWSSRHSTGRSRESPTHAFTRGDCGDGEILRVAKFRGRYGDLRAAMPHEVFSAQRAGRAAVLPDCLARLPIQRAR